MTDTACDKCGKPTGEWRERCVRCRLKEARKYLQEHHSDGIVEFLRDLSELTKRHGKRLDAPYHKLSVYGLDGEWYVDDDIYWNEEKQQYAMGLEDDIKAYDEWIREHRSDGGDEQGG